MNPVEARALALVGCPFRLHGRDPATGLDCVGVAAIATGAAAPTGYALRSERVGEAEAWLQRHGFARVNEALPGDLMLMRPGPGQLHLCIRIAGGVVHADLGLKRVVARPELPKWEVLGIWRRWF